MTTRTDMHDAIATATAALEHENERMRDEIKRLRAQLRTTRNELASERVKSAMLERQFEGYDEASFDPTKQKGEGAIPIGSHPFEYEVRQAEKKLGIDAPHVDDALVGAAPAAALDAPDDGSSS